MRSECVSDSGESLTGEGFHRLLNDGKDPTDGHDLALVLRDAAARTQLPAPHGAYCGLWLAREKAATALADELMDGAGSCLYVDM